MKPEDGGSDFERWLEAEFKRTLGPANGPSPRAAQAEYYAASRRRAQSTNRVAALTAIGLAVFIAVGVALGGGAVVATTTTGSANPAVWGQQLEAMVSDQVLTNERDASPSSSPDPTAAAGKHQRGERRTSGSPAGAPGNSGQSNENAGTRHDGCNDPGERRRPSRSRRH